MADIGRIDKQVRYFLKIAEFSSLSRAAEELEMTQSGLSRQLALLEAFIGKALFKRTGRGVELTHSGEKLQKVAQTRYAEIDAVIASISKKDGVTEGNLRIATIHSWNNYFVSDLLAEFVSHMGTVNLSVMARSSGEVVSSVEKGKADLGFVYDSAVASELLELTPLFNDDMCLVGRVSDYGETKFIDLTVNPVQLVGFPPHYALRNMLKSAGLEKDIVAEANTIEATLQLVSSGMGSCILPERIPKQLLDDYDLMKVSLIAPVLRRRVVAIIRHDAPHPSLARRLLEMAKNAAT